jgi:hypothetical protein
MGKMITCFILFVPLMLCGLSFNEIADTSLSGTSHSSLHWGDYDNDGFLDLLITGYDGADRISRVYRNNGDGSFTYQSQIALIGVWEGKGRWGDYNNNGLLDIIISGRITGAQYITELYRNEGDGTFTEQPNTGIPGVRSANINWIDYDNDGWLDLFLSGETPGGMIARLYRNNQDGTFSWQQQFQFVGFTNGDSDWIDLTGNGYQDLVIAGNTSDQGLILHLYLNQEGNSFQLHQHNLPSINHSSLSWGDFNNNGLPDLLVSGIIDGTRSTRVYRNNGGNSFVLENGINITGIAYGEAIWADLTNNGNLDIVICGEENPQSYILKVYQNLGNNMFAHVTTPNLTGAKFSALTAVDYNNNGKTDLLLSGMGLGNTRATRLYQNLIAYSNTPPQFPTGLTSEISEGSVILSWDNGTDIETPSSCLSYNLVLINSSEPEVLLTAPMSNLQNGFRRVRQSGNACFNNFMVLNDLPGANYQWAVQTIDSSMSGSAFTVWNFFTVFPETLSAPTNVQLVREGGSIILYWDSVEFASAYRIEGSEETEGGEWFVLDIVTESGWNVPLNYDRYFFRVIALD